MSDLAPLKLPARTIPFPRSISEDARNSLRAMAAKPVAPFPAPEDGEGWRRRIADGDAAMLELFAPLQPLLEHVSWSNCRLGDVAAFRLEPAGVDRQLGIVLDLHGGGLFHGGGEVCRFTGRMTAATFDAVTYSVDYRMPPDHPYPAPLDDCVTAYRALLGEYRAEQIVVRGSSAGGNLAAALMLRARAEGLPFPAALLLATPELDLTESGDSFQTNQGIDVVLKRPLMPANLLYADGHDLEDPYVSPLFGSFADGFPPTLITTGTRDLFLSNCVRMHNRLRRAGNLCELIVEEAMPHVGFFGTPEDKALAFDVRAFAERAWAGHYTRVDAQLA